MLMIMRLLSLKNIHLSYGHHKLLDGVSLDIYKGQRICLIGRNGTGKSSLLKIINASVSPDHGERIIHQHASIATLQQDVPEGADECIYNIVLQGVPNIGPTLVAYHALSQKPDLQPDDLEQLAHLQHLIDQAHAWEYLQKTQETISKLKLDPDAIFSTLSGGMKRRVLLAQTLVSQPDILLLDEPTNHLDIDSIEWLESLLRQFKGAIVFITHDRNFLQNVANEIIELDRGRFIQFSGDYQNFLEKKEAFLAAEQEQAKQFDKKLAQEEAWIRQGIKARRTRNEGRVRALEKMRNERQKRREVQASANITATEAKNSGRRVITATNIRHSWDDQPLIDTFSTEIQRQDKIAIIGPNGCGKSTLVQILLGKLQPDGGEVRLGTNLEIAYFDQLRDQLDESASVIDNIAQGSEFIEIGQERMHVISYLQRFLFDSARLHSPVSSLSGGEKNRLLVAKILSKPSNILVLDEPTNDLDIETLEVLEDMLLDYKGTIILISHDRHFINNIATSSIVFENGQINEYIGGYDEWLRQRTPSNSAISHQKMTKNATKDASKNETKANTKKRSLSYQQRQQLKKLPEIIEKLEDQLADIESQLADPAFYQQDKATIEQIQQQHATLQTDIQNKYEQWEALSLLEE